MNVKDKFGRTIKNGDIIDISPKKINGEQYFVLSFDTLNNVYPKYLNGKIYEWCLGSFLGMEDVIIPTDEEIQIDAVIIEKSLIEKMKYE